MKKSDKMQEQKKKSTTLNRIGKVDKKIRIRMWAAGIFFVLSDSCIFTGSCAFPGICIFYSIPSFSFTASIVSRIDNPSSFTVTSAYFS